MDLTVSVPEFTLLKEIGIPLFCICRMPGSGFMFTCSKYQNSFIQGDKISHSRYDKSNYQINKQKKSNV